MREKTQVKAAHIHGWEYLKSEWATGRWDEIYIIADGRGLSGNYDRVHFLNNEGEHMIVPAHHCEKIELINTLPEGEADA